MNKAQLMASIGLYKPTIERVESPLGVVYVRSMAGTALTEWQRQNRDNPVFPVRGQAIANCLCEEDGTRIGLSEAEVAAIDRLDTAATEEILQASFRVSKLTDEDKKAAEKNSAVQSGDSG